MSYLELKIVFGRGCTLNPAEGAHDASPNPLVGWKWLMSPPCFRLTSLTTTTFLYQGLKQAWLHPTTVRTAIYNIVLATKNQELIILSKCYAQYLQSSLYV